jgi:hypothetical protein
MLALYRSLMHLYPAAYRCEFGEEMMDVLSEVQAVTRNRGALARFRSGAHEAGGLLFGALQEHVWNIMGSQGRRRLSPMFSSSFLPGRFAMKSEFRFPKATVTLMVIILAAVIFTIEKAKAISASVPHTSSPVGHIQPAQITMVPTLLVTMITALVIAVIGWAVLFALHRSGVQQLSEMNPSAGQRSSK